MHTEVYGEPRQINTQKVRAFDSVASYMLGHPVSTENLAEMGNECAMQLRGLVQGLRRPSLASYCKAGMAL